jgi:anti-anti-sigma factor
MPNVFSTEVSDASDGIVIHVRGEFDMATVGQLRDAIEPHLGPDQTVVLDLSGVAFMDSQCFHVLLKARSTLTADGGSLILRNPSRAARNLLNRVNAERFLVIEADGRARTRHRQHSTPPGQLPESR